MFSRNRKYKQLHIESKMQTKKRNYYSFFFFGIRSLLTSVYIRGIVIKHLCLRDWYAGMFYRNSYKD
jgi:hypothetical protein